MAQVDPRLNAANKAALEGVGPTKLPFLLDFWLFFIAMMLGIGAGVTVVNNLSQMVSAYPTLAPDAAATSRSLMKLLACTNTLGRLASGSLSDKLAHKVGRVQFTVYLLALMAVGQFILAAMGGESAPLFGLVVGVFVVGWAFGALFWATPLLVMELFGPKNFGANRGLVGLSPAIGGYVMSTLVAGRVYAASAGWITTATPARVLRAGVGVQRVRGGGRDGDDVVARETTGEGARDGSDHVAHRAGGVKGAGAGGSDKAREGLFCFCFCHFVSFASHRLLVSDLSAAPKSVTARPIKSQESCLNSKTALGHELMNQKNLIGAPVRT